MGRVRPLRQARAEEDVRSRAEVLSRAGSPAAALALMTAAAEDAEGEDPHAAAVLLAEASLYARFAHGPASALEVVRRASRLAAGADGRVALVVHSRLGDALQWNGRFEFRSGVWRLACASDAECLVTPEPKRSMTASGSRRAAA